jgi:methyl-accepting chemotaxis protein
MWIPVMALALVLFITAVWLVGRTVRLVEVSGTQQEQMQARLELALGWDEMARTLAASAKADAEASKPALDRLRQKTESIQKLVTDADERKAYERVRPSLEAFMAKPDSVAPPLEAMEAFHKLQVQRGKALREQITKARMTSVYAVLAIVILVTLAISASTTYLVRTIINPVKSLIGMAETIAEGDLTHEVRVDRGDELGKLQQALSDMRSELADMVTKANQGADSVQTAAAEIASGNLDLSQRTETTAAHVQQTNSAITELGVAVRHSAESASTANQLAQQAAQVAQRGGEVVGQVVETMQQINASSKKISDIIGVIDGIAFQTNILALNAAVEAARAGEQGRGFAVVAGEVRSLASRSAEAAKEIKSLIGASVERVETGTRLVADAGSTMQELVGNVNRVSDVIGEISASTAEQTEHLAGVGQSMVQLDQMAQSNAALVEEGAAAAESLKDQAVKLHALVSKYRVAGQSRSGYSSRSSSGSQAAVPKPAHHAAPAVSHAKPAAKAAAPYAAPPPAAVRPAPAPKAPPPPATATSGNDNEWETF